MNPYLKRPDFQTGIPIRYARPPSLINSRPPMEFRPQRVTYIQSPVRVSPAEFLQTPPASPSASSPYNSFKMQPFQTTTTILIPRVCCEHCPVRNAHSHYSNDSYQTNEEKYSPPRQQTTKQNTKVNEETFKSQNSWTLNRVNSDIINYKRANQSNGSLNVNRTLEQGSKQSTKSLFDSVHSSKPKYEVQFENQDLYGGSRGYKLHRKSHKKEVDSCQHCLQPYESSEPSIYIHPDPGYRKNSRFLNVQQKVDGLPDRLTQQREKLRQRIIEQEQKRLRLYHQIRNFEQNCKHKEFQRDLFLLDPSPLTDSKLESQANLTPVNKMYRMMMLQDSVKISPAEDRINEQQQFEQRRCSLAVKQMRKRRPAKKQKQSRVRIQVPLDFHEEQELCTNKRSRKTVKVRSQQKQSQAVKSLGLEETIMKLRNENKKLWNQIEHQE